MQTAAYYNNSAIFIRYPRGAELYKPDDFEVGKKKYDIYGDNKSNILLITYGKLFSYACLAYEKLKEDNISICILKLNRIKPIPKEAINVAVSYNDIYFFEEGMATGGVGEHFNYELSRRGYKGSFTLTAIDKKFVKQGSVEATLNRLKLDCDGMTEIIKGK